MSLRIEGRTLKGPCREGVGETGAKEESHDFSSTQVTQLYTGSMYPIGRSAIMD